MQSDTMRHRNSQVTVLAQRRADNTLKPFIGDLPGWNGKAARLRALVDSFYSNEQDKARARLEGGTLLEEIKDRYADLHAAIRGEPPHSRLEDVDSAFRRLIDQLRVVTAGRRSVHQQDEQS